MEPLSISVGTIAAVGGAVLTVAAVIAVIVKGIKHLIGNHMNEQLHALQVQINNIDMSQQALVGQFNDLKKILDEQRALNAKLIQLDAKMDLYLELYRHPRRQHDEHLHFHKRAEDDHFE